MIKKTYLLIAIGLLASLLMASCGTKKEESNEVTETTAFDSTAPFDDIISNIAYINDGQTYHMLDIYGSQSVKKATPVVIEVHGGGFIGGTKETNADHSKFFANSGYVVVTPDYIKVPAGSFVNAIQDLFAAYNWVEANAEKYNFDLNNIFLSGDSAGGYYTLLTDAIMHSESLQEYFGVTPPSFTFTSYITSCPAADILVFQEQYNAGSFVAKTIGEKLIFDNDLMSHMDLFSNVDPQIFKGIYMLTTPGDTVCGPDTLKFDAYLTKNNVKHTLVSYSGTENDLKHVFNINKPDYVESNLANHNMVDFMDSLLK